MRHLKIFARGLGMTILPIGAGLGIARYIPPFWIGIANLAVLLFVIYVIGAAVPWSAE